MSEPAQPQPATPAPPAPEPAPAQPADSLQAGQPVTIEPAGQDGTSNATPAAPGDSTGPDAEPDGGGGHGSTDDDQPPGNPAAVGFPGEEPLEASAAEAQAAGHDTDPTTDGPMTPGPGAAAQGEVIPGAPDAVDLENEHLGTQLKTGGATSNETPVLPQNATTGAAKAHAALGQLIDTAKDPETGADERLSKVTQIAERIRAELDRYIPSQVRHAASVEAASMIRSIL